jgi:glycosyltransferase involved in cell wall biosynthesis
MINVALLTSAQPSANPRLVKEAKSLLQAGFIVSVIWCPISAWADEFDEKLFNEYPSIIWIKAGYDAKTEPIGYWYARIRQKVWKLIYKLIGNYFDAAIKSLVLYSQELNSIALQKKADLYIGHNLGALPAIVKAAKKNKAKSIFDFEDFHRGEAAEGSLQTRMVKEIENFYIPLVDRITTASSSITEAYQTIFQKKNIRTINNCFPLFLAVEYPQTLPQTPLKLFWFSQYVGKQRGLQTVIKAMSNFAPDKITLTLLGKASDEIKNYFFAYLEELGLNKSQLLFVDSVSENQLVQIASKHHIGLASEPGRDDNNEKALSNKIMIYLLAGNALLISDTISQKEFYTNHKSIGCLYKKQDVFDLSKALNFYIQNPVILNNFRSNALILAKEKLNWDKEQHIFLSNVQMTLIC